jgi:hypothetical protein
MTHDHFLEGIEYVPAITRAERERAWTHLYRSQRGYDRESAQVMAHMRCEEDELPPLNLDITPPIAPRR